jgi:outer membrane immunogenic protein
MKWIFIVVALSIVAAGPAVAADLPQAVPPAPQAPTMYVPVVAPVYNWGGFYFGINGGYGLGSSDWTGGAASSGSFDTSGFIVGGTAGSNYQFDAFVFGLETDLDYAPISGSGPGGFCVNCTTSSTWLGTTRARLGYAEDRVLFYGTVGAAYGDVTATANGVSNSSTEFGWTAGGGVEAAFADNWTARIEYLFVDLRDSSCTTACGTGGGFSPQSVSFDESLIRAGVDFKFR